MYLKKDLKGLLKKYFRARVQTKLFYSAYSVAQLILALKNDCHLQKDA